MIGLIAPLLLRFGFPERLHRAVTWIAVALIAAVLVWLWFRAHDAHVVERHDQKREATASGAREKSADEAVVDAFQNLRERDERDAAIADAQASQAALPPEARATIAPTTLARRCVQFRQAYSAEQLARMPTYQELCQ